MSEASPLQLHLTWTDVEGDVRLQTLAKFRVVVDGRPFWPAAGESDVALEIFVDDLLSHLTEFWKPLLLRQTYPVKTTPDRPSQLRRLAEQRWAELPPAIVDKEDERVSAFEDAHDLSRAFGGLYGVPSIYLFRSADKMLVDTVSGCCAVDFEAAHAALVEVGDQIAKRLDHADADKWGRLVAAWRNRDAGDPARLLAWSTGLTPAFAQNLVEEGALQAPGSVSEAANDDDELRLAARMSSALPPEQVKQVISLVRGFQSHRAPELDRLAASTTAHINAEFSNHSPHEQGEAAATFARTRLDIASVQRVDIFALVQALGADLHALAVQPATLDGLAVWGPRHGPAVLVNASSRRVSGRGDLMNSGAARVTVAHELCHLLLDGRHALSAVDVLNSRMPPAIEKRARAFAGEFLLPARTAADKWIAMGQPEGLDQLSDCLDRLCETYGVSRSVAAWKLEHGLHWHNIELTWQLDYLVPHR